MKEQTEEAKPLSRARIMARIEVIDKRIEKLRNERESYAVQLREYLGGRENIVG